MVAQQTSSLESESIVPRAHLSLAVAWSAPLSAAVRDGRSPPQAASTVRVTCIVYCSSLLAHLHGFECGERRVAADAHPLRVWMGPKLHEIARTVAAINFAAPPAVVSAIK
mmetsp:Transcript_22103/g.66356  ORF Transcript_22103/g.66356 Transcript_22103/m.66356 type:complete len:111 (-) Transcript_22103:107-439(-)